MTIIEDEDDVIAMRGAQKEVADELQEFDDVKSDDKQDNSEGRNNEADKELESWENNNITSITSSLCPIEQYALSYHETIDPYYSEFYLSHEAKQQILQEDLEQEWNINEIEQQKIIEEERALSEGDLLSTNVNNVAHYEAFFLKERAKIRSRKIKRRLTGENWEIRIDAMTKYPFYYNLDTGEAIWEKPLVLLQLEAEATARENKWKALPHAILVHVMRYLIPYPERMICNTVCKQWRAAASDVNFVKHVYPVELAGVSITNNNLFLNLKDALAAALPGDTIELGDGHYWLNESVVEIDKPVRIIGDEHDPSHVILEMHGTIVWKAKYGFMEGCTLRRVGNNSSKCSKNELLRIEDDGRINMIHCVLDNEGSDGSVCVLRNGSSKGLWQDVTIKSAGRMGHGISLQDRSKLSLFKCQVSNNKGKSAISCEDSVILYVQDCNFNNNNGHDMHFKDTSIGQVLNSTFVGSNFLKIDASSSVHYDKNVFEPCS